MLRKGLAVVVLGVMLTGGVLQAAPGKGRLPWMDFLELLRYQILGPEIEVPEKEYTFFISGPLTPERVAELEALGLTLVAAVEDRIVVRGPITAFKGLGPGGKALPWVHTVVPPMPRLTSDMPVALSLDKVAQATGVTALREKFPELRGDGVKVAVLDWGFTGELGEELGEERVHYLRLAYQPKPRLEPYVPSFLEALLIGRGWHGEACARAILEIAPGAELFLISQSSVKRVDTDQSSAEELDTDRLMTLSLLAGKSVDVDVVSDSTFWPYPEDHVDGQGNLAQAADRVVASGVPYFYAIGNFAAPDTTKGFYKGRFTDADGDQFHDFTPEAEDPEDRNSLSVEIIPEEGKCTILVVLEWDGWSYLVKRTPGSWTPEENIEMQDLDLKILTDGETWVSQREQLCCVMENCEVPPRPVEEVLTSLEPGKQILNIKVRNSTMDYAPYLENAGVEAELFVRSTEFHLYIFVQGGRMQLEHHSVQGSLLNVGGAHRVIGVGAVERHDENWCIASYSSSGPTSDGRLKPELAAPSCYRSPEYSPCFAGTSASAPVVAGIAALLLEAFPQATPDQIREALCQSARPLCGGCNPDCTQDPACSICTDDLCDYRTGCGLVNALAAYHYLSQIFAREKPQDGG